MYNLQTIEIAGQILQVKLKPDQNIGGTNIKEGHRDFYQMIDIE